jgi:choline-sulfatase
LAVHAQQLYRVRMVRTRFSSTSRVSPLASALSLLAVTSLVGVGVVGCGKSKGADAGGVTPTTATASAPSGAEAPGSASAAAAASAAPAADAVKGPYNVLVLSIDSMRADMPWNGYDRAIAPNLTKLFKKSVSYKHAYSISSFTSKSLGGFLGGRLPSELERTQPFFTSYLPSNKMFPEMLTEQGVHTLSGHGHMYLDKKAGNSGMDQGFADWRVVPGIDFDYNKDPHITSQKMTPMAIEMLSDPRATKGPFFGWFHYMDPHDVYKGHEEAPHFGKKARDLYDEEVFYTDLWIGKLLDFVEQQPWGKNTVIVVTADHGESFGEKKMWRHAFELWEVLVHVPLFLYVPGATPREIDARRSHLDLVPTMFELMGKTPGPELRGKSFKDELFGGKAEERDILLDLPEDTYNDRHRALIHEGFKIIAFGNDTRFEVYDLNTDPGEEKELTKTNPDKVKEMIELYKKANTTVKEAPIKGGVQRKH